MAGESNLRTGAPLSVRVAHQTRSGLRPFLRMVSRSSINKANVPAKVISKVAFQPGVVDTCQTERYYILDREYEAGSVIATLRDGSRMGKVLVKMMGQVEDSWKGSVSTGTVSPGPTLCSEGR